jgi:hypothetical protein
MQRALKITGYLVGGTVLTLLAATAASRLLRNYHTLGTVFPFPMREADMQPADLPEATRAERDPSSAEWLLMQAASNDGWPIAENMTFRTQAGQPFLTFAIEGQTIQLGYDAESDSAVISNYTGPASQELCGTRVTFTEFLKNIREH